MSVSRETLADNPNRFNRVLNGWSEAEIEVVMRLDLKPREMLGLLPNRTAHAVYTKRQRLGVAMPQHRVGLKLAALKQSTKARMNRRVGRLTDCDRLDEKRP